MPETLYADCNGSSIAYQVMGEGPPDIIKIPGIFSHVELYHEFPQYTEFFRKLSVFSRVIAYDKLGQGREAARAWLADHPDRYEQLCGEVLVLAGLAPAKGVDAVAEA